MTCSLVKACPEEHKNPKSVKYSAIQVECPVVNRNICMWCCLHIDNMLDPKTRMFAVNTHPEYAKLLEGVMDTAWSTCSKCSKKF